MKSHLLSPLVVLGASGLCIALASAAVTVESSSTSNIVEVAPQETTPQRIANLKLPPGFTITKFAELQNPRMIAINPKNGDIYISQREPGTVTLLKDTNHDGRADVQKVVFTRKVAHGLAIKNNQLFIVTIRELYKAPIKADGTLGAATVITNDLPDAGQHPNRTINFGPDGRLYMSVGSTTNAANEQNEENATILQFDGNGRNRRVFASGLRNTIGFGWHPTTGRFWGWDQGMDTFGDNTSKEEINEIKYGKRYGWPFVYEDGKLNSHPLPPPAFTRADWRKLTTSPTLMHTAHSAGIELTFYTGKQFPAEYRNDAFIALRGSWNRNPPSGYELARIHFDQSGKPVSVTPFVSGFLLQNPAPHVKWGHFARLAGVAQMTDGSLLLSDDTNNTVYRIAYGAKNTPRRNVAAIDARKIAFDLMKAPSTIRVTSNTFANGGTIPTSSSAYGQNISPDLHWTGVPAGTKSLVLIMDDPIARSPKPANHWLIANIASSTRALPKGIKPNAMVAGGMQGGNLLGETAYYGPKPPADGLDHIYHLQVFALDRKVDLPSGFNRIAIFDAMAKAKVLAKGQIVGRYERKLF
ncbi:hypothetical protein IAD21_00383 [Abditibacteriota bacterium]|nr:hypothetical protein IAD21_00383 [Abditibacteriota bacterium]